MFRPGTYDPWAQWLPILVLSGLWITFFFLYGSSGSQAQDRFLTGVRAILDGDLNLGSLRLIFGYNRRYLFKTNLWGLLFPINILLLAIAIPKILREKPPLEVSLLLAVLVMGILTVGIFYLGSFGSTDFLSWLTHSFPRELFPTAILMFITSIITARSFALNGE